MNLLRTIKTALQGNHGESPVRVVVRKTGKVYSMGDALNVAINERLLARLKALVGKRTLRFGEFCTGVGFSVALAGKLC